MKLLPVTQPDAVPPPFVATSAPVRFAGGFHAEEREGALRFRWMAERAALEFEPEPRPRFLECWVLSEFRDLSQALRVSTDDATAGSPGQTYRLAAGWAPLSVEVPAGASRVELEASRLFPREHHPGDERMLAVRLRDVRLHADPERHAAIARQHENSVLNQQELLDGRTSLASTPPTLGIDMHGACNVKPPCVYCEWDVSKALEGDAVGVPFTRETLREWGPFFDNSASLINCSIGEPFMMKNLDELFDIFGRTGKALEMTTNGQILTDRNIQKLLGLPIDLYVSLDAATADTYAKLRNDTFEKLLANLRRLITAKGGRGRPPYVHLVFMPMRCNLAELEPFVRLAASLDADRMVLRPLNYSDNSTLEFDRAGHHFEYKNELLPFGELVRASARASRLARALGVDLADQMDFGGSMREMFRDELEPDAEVIPSAPEGPPPSEQAATPEEPATGVTVAQPLPSLGGERMPACLEPWKSLYILRRGVLPCCYGGEPIAPMEEYGQAWNSPKMQAIRRELLAGRFHDYCLRSTACPIVRKSEQAKLLPPGQRVLMRARHLWWKLNRETGERPNRYVYLPIKRALKRLRTPGRPGR